MSVLFGRYGLPLWLSWWRICLQWGRLGFYPWVGKNPWKRERLPTPVFWPRGFHGLYSPWGHEELDMTEQLSLLFVKGLFVCLFFFFLIWTIIAYPTLLRPVDCRPPGFSVHGISQARMLEWVAISFCRRSSRPRNWTCVCCIAGTFFTIWATSSYRETLKPSHNFLSHLSNSWNFP